MNPTRRLAAIMFTDIAGYTAMMQANEAQALAIRQRHREVFERLHEQYRGQIVQYYGDGTLSVFDSAVDAVACARDMQLAFQEAPQVPLRIGIHTGDILLSETEAIGDGVNIASRIESLAVPGSVLLSESVYEYIKNQPELALRSLGVFQFKNVAKALEVFALATPGLQVPNPRAMTGKFDRRQGLTLMGRFQRLPLAVRYLLGFLFFLLLSPVIYFPLSQLVLGASPQADAFTDEFGNVIRREHIPPEAIKSLYIPHFQNLSGDSSLDWLGVGLPYALEMEWDQDPYLFSVFEPASEPGRSLKEQLDMAQSLQLGRLLRGTVAYVPAAGYEVGLQVYQARSGALEKDLTYRGKNLFALIDSLSRDLKLQLGVPPDYLGRVSDLPFAQYMTHSPEAYRHFSQGILATLRYKFLDLEQVHLALAADSTFAWAAHTLARAYELYQRSPGRAKALSQQAMRHRKRLPDTFEAEVRQAYYSLDGQEKEALELTRLLARLNPHQVNYALIYLQEAMRQEQYAEVLETIEDFPALKNDSRIYHSIVGFCYFYLGQYRKGIALLESYRETHPSDVMNQLALGQMYLLDGQTDKARALFERGKLLAPEEAAFGQFLRHMDFAASGGEKRLRPPLDSLTGIYWNSNASSSASSLVERNGKLLYLKSGKQYKIPLFPTDTATYCSAFGAELQFRPDSAGRTRGFLVYRGGVLQGAYRKVDAGIEEAFRLFRADPASAGAALAASAARHPDMQMLGWMQAHLALRQGPEFVGRAKRYAPLAGSYTLEGQPIVIQAQGDELMLLQQPSQGLDPVRMYEFRPGAFFVLENLGQYIEQEPGGRLFLVLASGGRYALLRQKQ